MTGAALQTVPNTAGSRPRPLYRDLLPELVAFTLHDEQAHWNLTGSAFPDPLMTVRA